MEVELKTAYCYYNLYDDCGKGLSMPSHTECKSCLLKAFEDIVRSKTE
ncbi:MAG: hypothetical protein LUP95_07570 [Euryarchaeota archaeon]|nr:hypothetical protein [Euryarchaeota archaeon]